MKLVSLCLSLFAVGCVIDSGSYDECGEECFDSELADDFDNPVTVRVHWDETIIVVGFEADVENVLIDLDELSETQTGALMFEELRSAYLGTGSDAPMMLRARAESDIEATQCANTTFRNRFLHRKARALEVALLDDGTAEILEPGTMVDPGQIRVLYNRNCAPTWEDGTVCTTPQPLLLHELMHAIHAMRGELVDHIGDPSDPMFGGSNHEEAKTIGRGAYVDELLSENAIRSELGISLRDSHGALCGPQPAPQPQL